MKFNTTDTQHKGGERKQYTGTKDSEDPQNRYRSGIGSLIYLVNYS